MTELEMIKKIQPLFEGWNVGDRGWDLIGNHYCIYAGNGKFKLAVSTNILHYPYPHQMWEKVDWGKLFMTTTIIGEVCIQTYSTRIGFTGDLEIALLKALVWQIERNDNFSEDRK